MPMHRTPEEKAKLTGAYKNHPERFKDRPSHEAGPIGPAPKNLSPAEKKQWKEFADLWPWLTEHDRKSLGVLCRLEAQMEEPDFKLTAAFVTSYRLLIHEFGGTPVSRSKVGTPSEPEEDDPFAKFGSAVN